MCLEPVATSVHVLGLPYGQCGHVLVSMVLYIILVCVTQLLRILEPIEYI